jgi:hypothetical protein
MGWDPPRCVLHSPQPFKKDADTDKHCAQNSTPVRVAVFSFLDDPSSANTVHAVISIVGVTMPSSVKVKYLAVMSVVQKSRFTWAGQMCFVLSCLLPTLPSSLFLFADECAPPDFWQDLRVRQMADGAGGHQDGAVRYDALSMVCSQRCFPLPFY